MDNNFWISAAIAAVVGGAWLFKKGKSAYSFIRKIRRSFKGVCLNPKSRLTDEQCKKIAIGAMYASQQGAYQNSIETGIPDMLPKILGEWWRIETTEVPERTGLSLPKRIPVLFSLCLPSIPAGQTGRTR